MKKLLFVVLLLCCMTVFGKAYAAAWELLSSTKDGSLYYDKNRIKTTGNSIKQVWGIYEYKEPIKVDAKSNRYAKAIHSLQEINCKSKQYRYLRIMTYFTNGRNISLLGDAVWRHTAPDTHVEEIYQAVCGK